VDLDNEKMKKGKGEKVKKLKREGFFTFSPFHLFTFYYKKTALSLQVRAFFAYFVPTLCKNNNVNCKSSNTK